MRLDRVNPRFTLRLRSYHANDRHLCLLVSNRENLFGNIEILVITMISQLG